MNDILNQLIKLPLPCIGTVLICAAYFTPNITPPSIQAVLYGCGVAILAAAGVHIGMGGGNTPEKPA